MLEIALYVVFGLAAIVAVVLVLASRRPDTAKFVRSTDIEAAPEAIFPLINDLRLLSTWSPFESSVFSGIMRPLILPPTQWSPTSECTA